MQVKDLIEFQKSPAYASYQQYCSLQQAFQEQNNKFNTQFPDAADYINAAAEIKQLAQQKAGLVATLSGIEKHLNEVTAQYEQAQKDKENNMVLTEFYKTSLEELTHEYLDSLSGTLTSVYQTVYDVQNKEVNLHMEDYRGKKIIKLSVVNHTPQGIFPEDLTNDGGSAQVILGTIVSIYFNLMTGGPRILFLDETLSALDTPILHRFLTILKKFTTEMEFIFVIVEHAAYRMKDFVDCIYTVESGVYREVPVDEWPELFKRTAGEING